MASMEEKSILDQMEATYIYGLPPLFVNEKVKLEDDEGEVEAQDEKEEDQDDAATVNTMESVNDTARLKNFKIEEKKG